MYRGHEYVQLLTTIIVARWVAAGLADDNRVSSVPVNVVLEHSEVTDRAAFLPRTASGQQALDTLTELAHDGSHPCALIFTKDGSSDQVPMGILTPSDVTLLVDALEWE